MFSEPSDPNHASSPMIGYYIHHQGSGHLHRALAVNQICGMPMTGLSTTRRPAGWTGDWVQLPDDAGEGQEEDPTAAGRLHYVPLGSRGLSARMTLMSSWIADAAPDLMVADVSVEVAMFARLHGVPVVVVAQPGRRLDTAHRLGYDIARTIIAPWPRVVGGIWGATASDLAKTKFVGAISRYAPATRPLPPHPRRVLVMNGTGGQGVQPRQIAEARAATPGWEWIHLDREHGSWSDDPWPLLQSAAVVVSHAGQNAVAEIAAARRPALLLPQDRPFDEQRVMAAALSQAQLPVAIGAGWPTADEWPDLLTRVAELDGSRWASWCDGGGQGRMARLLAEAGSPSDTVAARASA